MPNPVLPSCRWCPALPPWDRRRIPGLAEARRKEPAVRGCRRGLAGVSALGQLRESVNRWRGRTRPEMDILRAAAHAVGTVISYTDSAPIAGRLLGGCLLSATAAAWAWRLPPACSDLRYVHEAVAGEGAASTDRDSLTAAAGRAGPGRRPRGGRRAGPRRWRSWCGGRAGRPRRWAGARRRVAGARWRGR
jgi:hypothetical protein